MAAVVKQCAAVLAVLLSSTAVADAGRAHTNYLLHCQGCHLPEAVGVPGNVPRMNGFLGFFLHSQEGREFIVQVPGAATANLDDKELAELMNWMLVTYSADQLPDEFEPYTADEIAALRPDLEPDPEATRQVILRDIAEDLPALAAKLESSGEY